jgi:dTDP-4-amino-4,6-dideoxygalactose transaminase
MHIPLVDLSAQYQALQPQILTALQEVLTSMQLFLGPQGRAFEEEFAAYCESEQAVGCASGTDALVLALRACQIGPGDEVITVANTFIATVEAIALVGATPVFVDIDPQTYTLDPSQLERVLTPRTRALVPVHLYGQPADMPPLLAFARQHGLRVIEDASQAHGARSQGRRVGSLGDIGCFSLYYSKNLGAYGEAGICVTSDEQLADTLRMLRDHGSRVRYQHELLGTNSRLDELQAAILRVKLPHLEEWNAARQRHARRYSQQLQGVVERVPQVRAGDSHVFYVYVVEVHERERLREGLAQAGIATGIHYPRPLHLQPACRAYGYRRGDLPVTEAAAARIVSLPMYPELTAAQLETVVEAVRQQVAHSAALPSGSGGHA